MELRPNGAAVSSDMRLKSPTGAAKLQKYQAFVQTPSEPHKRPRLCCVIGSSGSQLQTRIRLPRTSDWKEFMLLKGIAWMSGTQWARSFHRTAFSCSSKSQSGNLIRTVNNADGSRSACNPTAAEVCGFNAASLERYWIRQWLRECAYVCPFVDRGKYQVRSWFLWIFLAFYLPSTILSKCIKIRKWKGFLVECTFR